MDWKLYFILAVSVSTGWSTVTYQRSRDRGMGVGPSLFRALLSIVINTVIFPVGLLALLFRIIAGRPILACSEGKCRLNLRRDKVSTPRGNLNQVIDTRLREID